MRAAQGAGYSAEATSAAKAGRGARHGQEEKGFGLNMGDMKEIFTDCTLCYHSCGRRVSVEEGKAVKTRGLEPIL